MAFASFMGVNRSGAEPAGGIKSSMDASMDETYRGKVLLIVNGDDVGVTPMFTDATLDAYFKGMLGSVSIIANGADVERAVSILKTRPELPLGVHLTLTGDWKPLTSGKSLRNASGLMWDTTEAAARNVKTEEAAAEWEAQVKKIANTGIEISHLDSHMACYFQSPELMAAAFALAKKYRVPLISPFIPGWKSGKGGGLFPVSSYSGIYRLEGKEETLENRAEAYWRMLGGFTLGVHYIFSHHSWEPPDGISGDMDLRINEYRFWTGAETRKRLSEKGYVLIGCGPLKKDFQAAIKE